MQRDGFVAMTAQAEGSSLPPGRQIWDAPGEGVKRWESLCLLRKSLKVTVQNSLSQHEEDCFFRLVGTVCHGE